MKIGKNSCLMLDYPVTTCMGNCCTWLSLVMSMMVSLCAVLFPRGVLDEILNLIESVSEGFLPTLAIPEFITNHWRFMIMETRKCG